MDDEFEANGTTAEGDEDSAGAEGLSPTLKGELWSDEDEEDGLHDGVPTNQHVSVEIFVLGAPSTVHAERAAAMRREWRGGL